MSEADKKINLKSNPNTVHLVTGVVIAVDEEDGILIAGLLSDNPFSNDLSESSTEGNIIGSFAFTKQKAKFFRDRLNEFLEN